MRLLYLPALATDPGKAHAFNEDAIAYHYPSNPDVLNIYGAMFALADGVGSLAHSDYAARFTLLRLLETYYHTYQPGSAAARLQAIVSGINREVFRTDSIGAATLSALILQDDRFTLAYAGDSPVFLVSDGEIRQLTTPHQITTREGRERLNRAVGHRQDIDIDVIEGQFAPGDRFILVSDGITRYYDARQIYDLTRTLPPKLAVETLMSGANQRGGRDNISVVMVEAGDYVAPEQVGRHARETDPFVKQYREALFTQDASQQATVPGVLDNPLPAVILLDEENPFQTMKPKTQTTSAFRVVQRMESENATGLILLLVVLVGVIFGVGGFLVFRILTMG